MEAWVDEVVIRFMLRAIGAVVRNQLLPYAAILRSEREVEEVMEVTATPRAENAGDDTVKKEDVSLVVSLLSVADEIEGSGEQDVMIGEVLKNGAPGSVEAVRPVCHLLAQLCLVETSLLHIYAELWAMSDDSSAVAAPAEGGSASSTGWSLRDQVRQDLRTILPALLAHNHKSPTVEVDLFNALFQQGPSASSCFTHSSAAYSLAQFVLPLLVPEVLVPPKPPLVAAVYDYLRRFDSGLLNHFAEMSSTEAMDEDAETSASPAEPQASQATSSTAPTVTTALALEPITSDEALKVALCVVGGLSASSFEAALPRILSVFAGMSYLRFTHARFDLLLLQRMLMACEQFSNGLPRPALL